MAYQRKDSGILSKSLGSLIGILLGLYVFNQVINAIMPQLCSVPATPAGWTAVTLVNVNSSTLPATCVWGNGSSAQRTNVAMGGFFGTSVDLITPLFGVMGILAVFQVVWGGLKRSGLV